MENGSENLRESIAIIEVAMLTSVEPSGKLRSRPMYTLQMDRNGALWFFTPIDSLKLGEIEKNNQVNLSYVDIHSHTYISITGAATVIFDEGLKDQFRESLHEDWFPNSSKSPELCLLKIQIEHAEVWNPETANMETVLGEL